MAYQIVTDGLVAQWDASTWTSGKTWTDSINSKVITFSSAPSSKTDDGIELTSSITFTSASLSSLGLSYPCTFEWLGRIDGAFNNSSPGHVFGLSSSSGSWAGICCYSKTSSNGVQLDIGSSGTITSGVYTTGIEYHIIVTVNSSRTTTLYVNSTTSSGTASKSQGYASKTYLYNNEGSGRFYGAIQRMCLWNKCLSSTEIETLFTEEVSGTGVFVNSGSTWTEAQTIYQKINGEWSEITVADLKSTLDSWRAAIQAGGATEPYVEETYDSSGNLIDVSLHGYTKIRNNMFTSCNYLALTSLPEGITSIGTSAFQGCNKLALTSLPEGLTNIDGYAFYNCYSLALTSLPEGVTTIGINAFYKCTGLTTITFKGTPTSIYSNAFSNCTNLITINVPWAEDAVANAPWGATNATINYNYTGE